MVIIFYITFTQPPPPPTPQNRWHNSYITFTICYSKVALKWFLEFQLSGHMVPVCSESSHMVLVCTEGKFVCWGFVGWEGIAF